MAVEQLETAYQILWRRLLSYYTDLTNLRLIGKHVAASADSFFDPAGSRKETTSTTAGRSFMHASAVTLAAPMQVRRFSHSDIELV